MSDPLNNSDARAKLAGTNKLEILQFKLGQDNRTGSEVTFGVNVSMVREVMHLPAVTRAPGMPSSAEGVVNLRGVPVPVINLASYFGIATDCIAESMIVMEYNGQMHGFLVRTVDSILFLDWSVMRAPSAKLQAEMGGLVTAITELNDDRLVMLLDVEKVLARKEQFDIDEKGHAPRRSEPAAFNDDALEARNQLLRTLDAMQPESHHDKDHFDGGQDGMPDRIDAHASPAGSETLEILLFSLGGNEKFGIRVSSVKEVCPVGKITRTPNMPDSVDGIVILHGHVVPVLNLAYLLGVNPKIMHRKMMVTDFNKRMLGLLVQSIDRIIHVDSDRVHAAERILSENGAPIASITELEDGSMISILDVKQILTSAFGAASLVNVV